MTCGNCGSPEVHIIKQTGGIESGRFQEHHQCETCGARGTVRGDAGEPADKWTRVGSVFE